MLWVSGGQVVELDVPATLLQRAVLDMKLLDWFSIHLALFS